MTGTFGVLAEPIEVQEADLTYEQRFGSADFADRVRRAGLRWHTGTDLLLLAAVSAAELSRAKLPSRPIGTPDTGMWIPARVADESPTGPVYRVRVRVRGALLRLGSDVRVPFLPGMIVALGEERCTVLGRLNGLDASRRARCERLLRRGIVTPGALFPHDAIPDTDAVPGHGDTGDPHGDSLSVLPPAAGTILDDIMRQAPGARHLGNYSRRGAVPLIRMLSAAGLVSVLPDGQIVAEAHHARLVTILAGLPGPFDPRDAAKAWGTTVGTARALLGRYATEGLVDRVPGGGYKVRQDA